jgi:hypothetical protein
MRHLFLSALLAFSVNTSFAADIDKTKNMSKCLEEHITIKLKTTDGKIYHAMVRKEDGKKLHRETGIEAYTPAYGI